MAAFDDTNTSSDTPGIKIQNKLYIDPGLVGRGGGREVSARSGERGRVRDGVSPLPRWKKMEIRKRF